MRTSVSEFPCLYMNKTVKIKWINDKTVEGLFRQSFFSCPTISKFISLHFKYHRYFYSASENNKLESGKIRVNMLTRRFAFVPPFGAAVPFNLERVNNCFLESNQQLPDWNV